MEIAYSGMNNPNFGINCAKSRIRIVTAETSLPEPATERKKEGMTPAPNQKKPGGNILKALLIGALLTAILSAGAIAGYRAFQHISTHEETDDAYVTGHLHQVSTRVNGTVEKVLVDDNQHVQAGQVLVLLDPKDYKVKVDQAMAKLLQAEKQAKAAGKSVIFQDSTAKGQSADAQGSIDNAIATIQRAEAAVRETQASIQTAESQLASKDAELSRAEADFKRFSTLEKEGAVSTSQKDAAKRDYLVALGNRDAAREIITQATERFVQAQQSVKTSKADLTKAEAQLQLAKASNVQTEVNQGKFETDLAAIAAAKAAVQEAELNLSYTKIVAPASGRIGKKTVEEGQRIEPGQALLTIVSDDLWVVANYKETQLKQMKAGQEVEIKIDSFPDHKFEGKVQSFSPASGASFAVLPSDNATGNFTKIVQRIPVKIIFTPGSVRGFEDRLAPGLSVVTSVALREQESTQAIASGLR